MAIVNFTRQGAAVGDHEAERVAMRIARYDQNQQYDTNCTSVLRALQVLIAEGKIPADKIVFTYEGEPIKVDSRGRFRELPMAFTDSMQRLEARFKVAVSDKARAELTEQQKLDFEKAERSWFEVNIEKTFVEGREFYFAPEMSEKHRITVLEGRKKHVVKGLMQSPIGHVLVTEDQQVLSMSQAINATFDEDGFRLVPEPFDPKEVFERIGVDTNAVLDPSFDLD